MILINRPSFDLAITRSNMKSLSFCVFECNPDCKAVSTAAKAVPGIYRVCVPDFLPFGLAVFGVMAAFYLDVPAADADRHNFLFEDNTTGDVFIVDDDSPTPSDDLLTLMVAATSSIQKVSGLTS